MEQEADQVLLTIWPVSFSCNFSSVIPRRFDVWTKWKNLTRKNLLPRVKKSNQTVVIAEMQSS
ncbi:MAG: hypothetical protein DME65_13835 [Verrucomicrobia bacterium]|nr:MAG: hypothetical protein DME65_13835 [Verrucomicrobiota bacterium]